MVRSRGRVDEGRVTQREVSGGSGVISRGEGAEVGDDEKEATRRPRQDVSCGENAGASH